MNVATKNKVQYLGRQIKQGFARIDGTETINGVEYWNVWYMLDKSRWYVPVSMRKTWKKLDGGLLFEPDPPKEMKRGM